MLKTRTTYKVDLYHNIMWSKYKALVFSSLFEESRKNKRILFNFYQIAESEGQRDGMGRIDTTYHNYPYQLLYTGSYDEIGTGNLMIRLFFKVLLSNANLVLLPGYYRPEHWAMLLACLLRRKRRVVFSDSTIRDKPTRILVNVAKRFFLFFCDAAFTYGQRGKENLISLGIKPSNIVIRCQAAALPKNYKIESVIDGRILKSPSSISPRFLFVGRLSDDKSIDVLLEAFAITISKYPESSLIIVGKGHEEEKLINLAFALGVSDHVKFLGGLDLDAIASEYQKATCLILPSRKEPWGLVVNEALHYGCPVIASDNCGCVPELLQDSEVGMVFETDNVLNLSAAMIKAPIHFSNIKAVAKKCLDVISNNTPSMAAKQIHDGCLRVLSDTYYLRESA